jgi:hypothetical protein
LFGQSIAAALIAAAALASPAAAKPHLFLDPSEAVAHQGLRHVISRPTKAPAPIITGTGDQNSQPYVSVLKTPTGVRLWYDANDETDDRRIGVKDSADGLTFDRPATFSHTPTPLGFGVSVIRDGGGFRLLYYGQLQSEGVNIAASRDGVHWKPQQGPMFTLAQLGPKGAAGDIVSWVKDQGRYLMFTKLNAQPDDGYAGFTPNMPYPGYRRLVGLTTSSDGTTWPGPTRLFVPDAQDPGITQFYGVDGVIRRGDLLVGFVRMLRDDIGDGIGWTALVWSSDDGKTWHRDRHAFLARTQGAWDGAIAWGSAQLVMGDKTVVYYGGYRGGHKSNPLVDRQIGVATLGRDRYASYRGTGTLTTRRVRVRGLTINANVRGSMTVRAGRVTCQVRGNGVALRPRCDGPLPAGPVRLSFRLRDASLFGYTAA